MSQKASRERRKQRPARPSRRISRIFGPWKIFGILDAFTKFSVGEYSRPRDIASSGAGRLEVKWHLVLCAFREAREHNGQVLLFCANGFLKATVWSKAPTLAQFG